jgi:hypothetical protein
LSSALPIIGKLSQRVELSKSHPPEIEWVTGSLELHLSSLWEPRRDGMTKKQTLKVQIDRLPDLPVATFEVAGQLGYADNVPVVTIRPRKFPVPKKPSGPLAVIKKSDAAQRRYWSQVTYPRVICHHPDDVLADHGALFVEQGTRDSDKPNADVAAIAKRERFYKLTKLKGAKLKTPLWCSVKYGPWLAIVVEQESCISGVPNFWQLAIVEMPQVALSWYGQWEDIPSYPLLNVIMGDLAMFQQSVQCCPGYKFCPTTMSCIPNAVPCQDVIPA